MYREAAFAVLNQETGPEIQSVYMTVAADLVLNQVRFSDIIQVSKHYYYYKVTRFSVTSKERY